MKRKRLDRDLKWGFQYFPYYQVQLDCEIFHGLACLIELTDGKYIYWDFPKAGKTAVCGGGMVWLQLVPKGCKRLVTVMLVPERRTDGENACGYAVSCIYIDVIEGLEYDPDGVAAYVDKYLDVKLTPAGDVIIDDRDELEEAFARGELSKNQYEEALTECGLIISQTAADIEKTEKRCLDILKIMQERIAFGEKPMENRTSQNINAGGKKV